MISKGRRITATLDVYGENFTEDWQAVWGRVGRFGARVEEVSGKRPRTPCEGIYGDLRGQLLRAGYAVKAKEYPTF